MMRTRFTLIAVLGAMAHAQQLQLPNPYRLVENWPTIPQNMNGGKWGELIRADIDPKGNLWYCDAGSAWICRLT